MEGNSVPTKSHKFLMANLINNECLWISARKLKTIHYQRNSGGQHANVANGTRDYESEQIRGI